MDKDMFKNKLKITITQNDKVEGYWEIWNNDDTDLLVRMCKDDVQGFVNMLELAVMAIQKDYMQFILDQGTYKPGLDKKK